MQFLYSERYGEYSDYTRKGGVICSHILLPPQAPPEYQDRQTLWNAVEEVERHKDAQLAYSFDIALQNGFSLEENIALARQFLLELYLGRKEKFAFYLIPEKKAILERRFQEDGSRSMTAFVERAVDFYLDYLSANDADLFLPTSIKSYLDGRLGQLEERLSSIAFRQAVEQDMVAGILADAYQFSGYLRHHRLGLWDGHQDVVHHPGPCVLRHHVEHLLPYHRRDEAAGGDEDRPGHRQGRGHGAGGKAERANDDHLPGKEAVEPKGKLNDREPARREERYPPAGQFSLSVGKHVVRRRLAE